MRLVHSSAADGARPVTSAEAMGYVLSLPGVSTVIIGCSSPAEVDDNARIARSFQPFDEPAMQALEERTPCSRRLLHVVQRGSGCETCIRHAIRNARPTGKVEDASSQLIGTKASARWQKTASRGDCRPMVRGTGSHLFEALNRDSALGDAHRFQVLLADRGNLVVEVLRLRVLRALLDHLVLEQGLEDSVLGFLRGMVALGVLVGDDPLEQLMLRCGQLGANGLLGGRLLGSGLGLLESRGFLRGCLLESGGLLRSRLPVAGGLLGGCLLRAAAFLRMTPTSPSSLLRSCSQP